MRIHLSLTFVGYLKILPAIAGAFAYFLYKEPTLDKLFDTMSNIRTDHTQGT